MYRAYLGAFTGSLEFSNRVGVDIFALVNEEVGIVATQRTEGLFTAERGDELGLDYAMVSVVVNSEFSYRKYCASDNTVLESNIPDPHHAKNSTSSSYSRA